MEFILKNRNGGNLDWKKDVYKHSLLNPVKIETETVIKSLLLLFW